MAQDSVTPPSRKGSPNGEGDEAEGRLRTGVKGLDSLMGGGVPQGSTTLLVGPPGSGKSTMGLQFLYEGLTHGQPAILAYTHEPLNLIIRTMKSFGWSPTDKLTAIDCYSWKGGSSPEAPYQARSMMDLSLVITELAKKLQLTPGVGARFVLDSLSDFLLYGDPESAVKYLGVIKSKLVEVGITSFILVEEGLHEVRAIASVEYIVDGTIKMKSDEAGRQLIVSRMVATPLPVRWVPFKITKGIEVRVASFLT